MELEAGHIFDVVERQIADRPDREALAYGDREWTWAQLGDRVLRAAGALRSRAVGPGDRVAFIDKNHPACLELTLAASLLGAAHAVINYRLSPEEFAYVLRDSGAQIAVVGHEFEDTVNAIRHQVPDLRHVIILGGAADEYEDMIAGADPISDRYIPEPDDCFLQLYTSGTTGWPKGAMLTHRSVLAHSRAIETAYGFDETTVNLVAMPLFHVGGTCWALAGMAAGCRTILTREVNPTGILEVIKREQVTHAFLVPAVIQMLLQEESVVESTPSLRVLGYGGSPMPAPLIERLLGTLNTPVYSVYGMTETSGIVCVLGPDEHRDPQRTHLLKSVGRPVSGVEVRVVDPVHGRDVEVGEVGEYWVRSAQVMAGYWRRPEATAETIVDGWLRTGDAGRIDSDGYLFLEDRVKDMVISGGENIYPAEVERVLIEHAAVAEVAVIGVPHDKWGEAIHAVVALNAGASAEEQELINYCRERLAHYKCPTHVSFMEALPRNATGKLLKRSLRQSIRV